VDGTTNTDSGSLHGPDIGNEESQDSQKKAPVRFGWMIGVMVSRACLCLSLLQIKTC